MSLSLVVSSPHDRVCKLYLFYSHIPEIIPRNRHIPEKSYCTKFFSHHFLDDWRAPARENRHSVSILKTIT